MRIVSLVPSVTETLVALGVPPIACTRFCDLDGVPTVGGTKNPDVTAIVALGPDLVVVNDEENRVEDADALADAGVALHDMSPRSVRDVGPCVRALADAVRAEAPPPFDRWDEWLDAHRHPAERRGFVATWRRPYMTLSDDTFGASLLALLGITNVFGDAAVRYPEVTLDEVANRAPDVVLLPDEPYPFTHRHVPEVQRAIPNAHVMIVDGRDVFWWGIRTPAAIDRLAAVV